MAEFATQDAILDIWEGDPGDLAAAHVPNYGGPWANINGYAFALDGVGGVYQPATNADPDPVGLVTPALPGADCFIQATLRHYSTFANSVYGVAARGTGADTFYYLRFNPTDGTWALVKSVAGVKTSLGEITDDVPIGAAGSCMLICQGTSIRWVVKGVEQTPVVDAAIAGPGWVGLVNDTNGAAVANTGIHLEAVMGGYFP